MNTLQQELFVFRLEELLCGPDGGLLPVNRDMLRLLSLHGGQYTVYTDGSPEQVERILQGLPMPKAPILCYGGASLFWCGVEKPLQKAGVSGREVGAVLEKLRQKYPALGVLVQDFAGTTWVLHTNADAEHYLHGRGYGGVLAQMEDLPAQWAYAALCGNREQLRKAEEEPELWQGHFQVVWHSSHQLRLVAPQRERDEVWAVFESLTEISPQNLHALGGVTADCVWLPHAGQRAAAADAAAELKLAAGKTLVCSAAEGAAAEYLYGVLRRHE